ncbi:MAG: class I SAM-dependent methyltransferase [Bacteroidales bacterium]|nr:class I SAM-dependent methyltransferase [Bacteroidales bacterium]
MIKSLAINQLTEEQLVNWYAKIEANKKFVDFYTSELKKFQGPMLEINCGTGEILSKLLSAGISCDGLESSSEQIKICNNHLSEMNLTTNLYNLDFTDFNLPNKYNTIFIPQATFCMISDIEKAKHFLANVFSLLENGGSLIFDVFIPWKDIAEYDSRQWKIGNTLFDLETSEDFVHSYNYSFDLSEQIRIVHSKYELYKNGELVAQYFDVSKSRWYGNNELTMILESIGFNTIEKRKIFENNGNDYSTLFIASKLK